MYGRPEMITPAEASVIAGVELRDIHRVFDEGLLTEPLIRKQGNQRLVARDAALLLRFYFGADRHLSAEARRAVLQAIIGPDRKRVLGRLSALPRWHRTVTVAPGIAVSLAPYVTAAENGAARFARARAVIVEDPDVLDGMPVIRGTRLPVYDVAASLAAGASRERVQSAYPSLTAEQIDLAALYAQAVPPRGRPRQPAQDRPPGARRIASRQLPRRAPGAPQPAAPFHRSSRREQRPSREAEGHAKRERASGLASSSSPQLESDRTVTGKITDEST